MSTVRALYDRWIIELWDGQPIAAEIVTDDFVGHWPDREVHGPLSDGDLVAGRWVGTGLSPDGPVSFTGNDILRLAADGQRFAEYWTGTSAG